MQKNISVLKLSSVMTDFEDQLNAGVQFQNGQVATVSSSLGPGRVVLRFVEWYGCLYIPWPSNR